MSRVIGCMFRDMLPYTIKYVLLRSEMTLNDARTFAFHNGALRKV